MFDQESTFPVQITFHGVPHSAEVEAAARERVWHLTRFHPRIHGARVVIGKAEGHAKQGRYHVQVRVAIPGNDVVVGQHPSRDEHDDALRVLADVFRQVERRLEEDAGTRQGRARARRQVS